jgi:hypothetical protein
VVGTNPLWGNDCPYSLIAVCLLFNAQIFSLGEYLYLAGGREAVAMGSSRVGIFQGSLLLLTVSSFGLHHPPPTDR